MPDNRIVWARDIEWDHDNEAERSNPSRPTRTVSLTRVAAAYHAHTESCMGLVDLLSITAQPSNAVDPGSVVTLLGVHADQKRPARPASCPVARWTRDVSGLH